MNNFRDFLPPDSADAVITAMVRAILLGYEDAAARFDPTVGCDPNTFGTETWRFIWYRLEQELASVPGVETTRAESSFAIIIGDLVIRCIEAARTTTTTSTSSTSVAAPGCVAKRP